MEGTIGEIRMFAGNRAPSGWAFCSGQTLPIAQNTALYSILGTTYGGNGETTFALPDLRGRAPIHAGHGPGLTSRTLGESGGSENVTLTASQMPAHTHSASAATGTGTSTTPSNNVWASSAARDNQYAASPNGTMSPTAIGAAGGSQPHNNMQPYAVINYIICLQGLYPVHD